MDDLAKSEVVLLALVFPVEGVFLGEVWVIPLCAAALESIPVNVLGLQSCHRSAAGVLMSIRLIKLSKSMCVSD